MCCVLANLNVNMKCKSLQSVLYFPNYLHQHIYYSLIFNVVQNLLITEQNCFVQLMPYWKQVLMYNLHCVHFSICFQSKFNVSLYNSSQKWWQMIHFLSYFMLKIMPINIIEHSISNLLYNSWFNLQVNHSVHCNSSFSIYHSPLEYNFCSFQNSENIRRCTKFKCNLWNA